eukprot:TRINITY_DN75164_c0_g1_i1.p1 TRINITY_DN75164_c0_g1~~TRINITY_DN75164_c0_g1_i1.p1  ORF type:complete len:252 (-),score=68.83 TRINITY_DN75164_c0_g1_i1:77-832(-)
MAAPSLLVESALQRRLDELDAKMASLASLTGWLDSWRGQTEGRLTVLDQRLESLEKRVGSEKAKQDRRLEALASQLTNLGEEVAQLPTTDTLQQQREHDLRGTAKALDGLSQRLSEVGVELATLPLGAELHGALQKLDEIVVSAAAASVVAELCQTVEVSRCRLDRLHVEVFGAAASEGACKALAEEAHAGVSASVVTLQERVKLAEHRLDGLDISKVSVEDLTMQLANKADAAHHHDRLVSQDGSVTFQV